MGGHDGSRGSVRGVEFRSYLVEPVMPALVSALVRLVDGTRLAVVVGREGWCEWVEVFSVLPDPRRRQGLRLELEAVLGLALAAVIGGARSYRQIAEWVADLDVHVRRRFGAHRAGPSAATIRWS